MPARVEKRRVARGAWMRMLRSQCDSRIGGFRAAADQGFSGEQTKKTMIRHASNGKLPPCRQI
jgi:hypothetical protein